MNSTIKPKPCPECGSKFHSRMWHKPRKPLNVRKELKQQKSIKRQGKHFELWGKTRTAWIQQYMPPDVRLPCHYCGEKLSFMHVTLDHRIPRSRAPELRYEFTNLVPCCWNCNRLKGSTEHDKYPHKCNDRTPV